MTGADPTADPAAGRTSDPDDAFAEIASACTIVVPEAHRRPIAIVGAGSIVDVAHLPAYRAGGLDVVGIFDLDHQRARDTADRHGIATVYGTLDELLDDPRIGIVDVAVTSPGQPEVVRRAVETGHHVLSQKPFAPDPSTAEALADLADARGTILVVNQQLRFEEAMAAAHAMVRSGWIGSVTAITVTVDIWTEWSSWPWILQAPRLEVLNHSIHYHDVVRWFLGEPEVVFSAAGRSPEQVPVGETRSITTCTYGSGVVSTVHANHQNARGDNVATFQIDGSTGWLRGTMGLLYDYPKGRPSTLEVWSPRVSSDVWVPYPVTRPWVPDAFLGPMASLLDAAATGSTPRSSARENVGTIRLVEAIYRSMETGTAQRFSTR